MRILTENRLRSNKPNTMKHRTLLSFSLENDPVVTIELGCITAADDSGESIIIHTGLTCLNAAVLDYVKTCNRSFQEQLIQTLTDQIRPNQTDAN